MKLLRRNIVLIGMPGSGKTTIGRLLAKKMKARFYDVDKCIRMKEGKSIPEIFKHGEDYFRLIESRVIQGLSKKQSSVISTGGGSIKLSKNIDALKKNGIIIFINRDINEIIDNVKLSNRPLLGNDKDKIYKLYNERIHLYKKFCDYEIINDSSLEVSVNKVYELVNSIKHDKIRR